MVETSGTSVNRYRYVNDICEPQTQAFHPRQETLTRPHTPRTAHALTHVLESQGERTTTHADTFSAELNTGLALLSTGERLTVLRARVLVRASRRFALD